MHAVRWENATTISQALTLPHGVDRIEALGRHAVLVGPAGKDLHFSSLRLNGGSSIPHSYTRENATQGETHSHGLFYKPDADGLPVVCGGRPGNARTTTAKPPA